jgi:hypothetical protein
MSEARAEETVIVGASAAGLATAASLKRIGRPFLLLEKAAQVGAAWRGHYQRLHLHTSKGLSGLPGFPMPRSYPRYPSREQVIAYLEEYARHFDLQPELSVTVRRIVREGSAWRVESSAGTVTAGNVVVATGNARVPHQPSWPGQETFRGRILHSSAYQSGETFSGQRVLVVGFGNSGGEIAIDLHEHGALPDLAVRGAVNVIPRDLFGLPILAVGIAMDVLPPKVADLLSAPLLRLSIGDVRDAGLRKLPYGPFLQINRHGRIPLLDVGTLKLIRQGVLKVRPGLERFTERGVVFEGAGGAIERLGGGGEEATYDAVVLATGYRPAVGEFLEGVDVSTAVSGREVAPGLYLCGFYVSPTGMLREIAREAKQIAAAIAQKAPAAASARSA